MIRRATSAARRPQVEGLEESPLSDAVSNRKRVPSVSSSRRGSSDHHRRRRQGWNVAILLIVVLVGTVVFVWIGTVRHVTSRQGIINNETNSNLRQEHDKPIRKAHSSTTAKNEDDDNTQVPDYHMVFSSGCSPFQSWQSLVFFYHAHKVQQRGTITRIVSGCTTEEMANATRQLFQEQIQPISDHFFLHITPNWDFQDSEKHKYFNKPFGILHWFQERLGYPSSQKGRDVYDDSIIMILDPDMLLLRPLTHDFSSTRHFPLEYWMQHADPSFPSNLKRAKPLEFVVRHGFPISQAYAFGDAWWRSFHRVRENMNTTTTISLSSKSFFDDKSPIHNITIQQATYYYPSGPPYLATARDMYSILELWVQLVKPLLELGKADMMSEMYGYSMASAYLGLSHQLTEKFMISEVEIEHEGWDFIEYFNITRADACHPTILQNNNKKTNNDDVLRRLPFVLHYCSRYAIGRWFVGKYKLPEDFFTCQSPLIRTPPSNVGELYDWFIYPNGFEKAEYFHGKRNDDLQIKWNVFAMCTMMDALNEAARYYKQRHCIDGVANVEETFIFQDPAIFADFLEHGGNGIMV